MTPEQALIGLVCIQTLICIGAVLIVSNTDDTIEGAYALVWGYRISAIAFIVLAIISFNQKEFVLFIIYTIFICVDIVMEYRVRQRFYALFDELEEKENNS